MPANFPPAPVPSIVPGIFRTAIFNLSASLPGTAIFTAPVDGWYLVNPLVHLESTNNAGTLTVTWTLPHGPVLSVSPTINTGKDSTTGLQPYWLAAGESVTVTTVAAGMTGTVYTLYFSALQLLNPPPEVSTTFAVTNQTGSLATTPLATIPETGLYMLSVLCHLLTTDKAGTLTGTLSAPNLLNPLTVNPDIPNGLDSRTAGFTFYCQAGAVITLSMTAAGLTGTTYNVLGNLLKIF